MFSAAFSSAFLHPRAPAKKRLHLGVGHCWGGSDALNRSIAAPTAAAQNADRTTAAVWHAGAKNIDAKRAIVWRPSRQADSTSAAPWGGPMGIAQAQARMPWALAVPIDRVNWAPWGGPLAVVQCQRIAVWQTARPADERAGAPWGGPLAAAQRPTALCWVLAVSAAPEVLALWDRYSLTLNPGWGIVTPGVDDIVTPGANVVVPTLRSYVTINSIILHRVDGDIPIPAYSFAMSLDWQSWTWSWSASIALASLPLITPGSDGQPVEVEALVNGVPYRLVCEGFGSQKQFASGRVGVKGRGLAAVLDAPYAPVLNFASASDRTAQQLMLDALTVNGVSLGWDVAFGLTDWLVPGNTWAHQGEYISAVTALAQAAGGYVQPHDTDKTLRILPGYPTAPWAWGDVTPDFELPSSVVTVEGIDWTRKPDYNRVFVSGMGGGGVLGQVTRAGTAGDIVAPMVTDALITHADAARQRGLSVLADTGMQARVNLTLPVLAETGLIKPGNFVRYTDAGTARMGLVRNTGLTWAFPRLRQTLAVETHIY